MSIRKLYPQYGTEFWGSSAEDNYGFGSSDIEGRIGQVTDRLDNGGIDHFANAKRQEENRPWVDKNPIGRLGVAVTQGIANSSLNPAGYIARAAGMDTRPFEPQNAAERIGELAGQYGFDAAVIATGLGGAAEAGMGGTGVAGNIIKTMAQGGVPLALTGSTGSAITTGAINPQNQYARMFTDLLGGGISASMAARPKIQVADRNDIKAIKQLTSEIGKDALDDNISEAQRTGRSLLEVGNDEIIQAGQRARQQTPEARKIFNERIAEIAEAQPARMRNVIDDTLGTQGKNASVAQVAEEARRKAEPLFNDVRSRGDLAVNGDYLTAEQLEMRQPLIDQLNTGNYADIPFGALSENVRKQVNQIRINNGEVPLDADMIIPAGVVQKWSKNRMFENYTPERIAKIADEVYHSADVNVSEGSYPHIQKLIKERPEHNNDFYGFVSRDNTTGQTTAKTVYEKGRSSAGRQPTSLQNENSAGRMRLSDLQTSSLDNSLTRLRGIVKQNDVVADAIKKVKQSYSSLKKLPDTDANVLIEARKLLSEQSVSPNTTLAFQAKTALKEFDPVINNVTGGKLAQANRLYQDAHQYERAADLGRDVFNGRKGVEDFNTSFNGLSDMEKSAAQIGLRDELLNKIGSATNESVATKKFLPQNVRDKMAAIAGKENADKIIDEAEQSVKSMRNINKFIGGSQTSEKQRLRDVAKGLRGFIRNPWDKTVDAVFSPFDNARNVRMAQYLTDPNIVDAYNSVLRQQQVNNAMIPLRDIYLQNLMRTVLENQ